MSVETAIARITQIQTMLAPPPAPTAATAGGTQFDAALASATSGGPMATAAVASPMGMPAAGGSAGARALAAAQAEVGVAEQPPGSNDSARIAQYRQATAGSGVGPWCAYFVSWAAQQAGAPIGEQGQGMGATIAVEEWGRRTGRALPPGQPPQPGDLIVWGSRHIGIVESVGADGSINTIEGNSSDSVARRKYGPDGGGASSYVRLG
jgi:CHAP domain